MHPIFICTADGIAVNREATQVIAIDSILPACDIHPHATGTVRHREDINRSQRTIHDRLRTIAEAGDST